MAPSKAIGAVLIRFGGGVTLYLKGIKFQNFNVGIAYNRANSVMELNSIEVEGVRT